VCDVYIHIATTYAVEFCKYDEVAGDEEKGGAGR